VTLVRNNGQVLPVAKLQPPPTESETFSAATSPGNHLVAIIMTDSVRGESGRNFENAVKQRRADATVFYVDNTVAKVLGPEILQAIKQAVKVVVATYIVPVPAKQVVVDGKLVNSVGLEQGTGDLLGRILETASAKTAVIAMGSPYVAQSFPSVQTYICTYSNASTSELSAVKVLFGELQPQGKLPVMLPGISQKRSSSQ
jgi:beta-N-acetylhexosaminidase